LEDALRSYPGTILLISHDRYLIRNVADSMLEVEDARAKYYRELDESVLTPGEGFKPSSSQPNSKKSSTKNSKKIKRQESAESRKNKHSANKDLKKRVNSLERKAIKAEQKATDLEKQLADPETYADKELMSSLLKKHDVARAKADKALLDWETAAEELEKS